MSKTELHKKTTMSAVAITVSQAANKVITIVSQIMLAWFLVPADMGKVALALSIANIGEFFTSSGVRDVLVQKQDRFEELKGSGATLAILMNLGAILIIGALAPTVVKVYNEPVVLKLIWISISAWFLHGLINPYKAKMSIDMEFKTLAFLYALEGLIFSTSCVILAWQGFGATSMVLPLLWKSLFTYFYLRYKIKPIKFQIPTREHIKVLLGTSIFVTAASLTSALQKNGVNYAAGIRGETQVVGLYYWGYTIASQAVFLLALNLRQVFFPAFRAELSDPTALRKLVLHWLKRLSIIIVPICLLQFALAPYLIKWVFAEKWWPAIVVVQYISLALVFAPIEVIGGSLIMARGHFKQLFVLRSLSAIMLFGAAWYGVRNNSIEELVFSTAFAVAGGALLIGLGAVRGR